MRPMAHYDDRTALLVIDVQNDFADPHGSLYVTGGNEILALINAEIASAQAAGALVVYTQDWHPPDTPHFAKDGGIWPVHCVAGSWGSQLATGLVEAGPVVRKGTAGEDGYSGFTARQPGTGIRSPTGLAAMLEDRGVNHVVVVGLATDYCVKDSVLDALRLGLAVTVLTGAVRAVDLAPGDGARALSAMEEAGAAMV